MSIIKSVKRSKKKREKRAKRRDWSPDVPASVVVKILPNQQEGAETGKESIWINQSIYKCTKYIHYIKRVPFSVVFLFLLAWEGIIFTQTELAEVAGGPSARPVSPHWLCCCHGNPPPPLTSTAASAGRNGTGVPSAPFTALRGNNTQTFVNCMQQKSKLYHYFKIVYVKVIFLHVDCCYFVF